MSINSDQWVPGGRAEYLVDLKREGDGTPNGSFKGTFRGKKLAGKATAEGIKPPKPPKDFVPFKPGEHPRILFRKGHVPALKQRASAPVGSLAMKRIKADQGDAVALGVMSQLTGNQKYAGAAVPLVRAKMKERGEGAFTTATSGENGSLTWRWLTTCAGRHGGKALSARFSATSTG